MNKLLASINSFLELECQLIFTEKREGLSHITEEFKEDHFMISIGEFFA